MDILEIGLFDLAFGSMILCYVEPFEESALALQVTLRPGDRAFFYENSASNALLMLFRRRLVGKLGCLTTVTKKSSPYRRGDKGVDETLPRRR